MNNRNVVIALVVILLVVLAGWAIWAWMDNQTTTVSLQQNQDQTPGQNTENNGNNNGAGAGVDIEVTIPTTHTVTYTDSGYAPGELKIKAGDTVMFKNQSSGQLWTGSAMHPSHTGYNGTTMQQHCPNTDSNDFDQCKAEGAGTSWSFTFNKKGGWGYHNHVKATHFGKIVVE